MESIRWMVELAAQTEIERIVLNCNFVTDIIEPNDVDCALMAGSKFPLGSAAGDAFESGFPFLEISIVPKTAFELLVNEFFATDRVNRPKGMLEVIQWH